MTLVGEQGSETPVILVVDDEPMVLRAIGNILTLQGYRVLAAGNAREAIEVFRREPRVGLLLTDVMMPGLTGPELADMLLLSDPGLRVLFTAGLPDSPLIRTAVLDRGFPFIPKPFLPAELSAKVRQSLALPRACMAHAKA